MATRQKPQSFPVLKRKLWKIFSEYVRRRDKGICFTCGNKKRWQDQDAGHYIARSIGGMGLFFEEKNVHCQCTACNRFRHGNLVEYSLELRRKYGNTILEELAYKKKKITKFTTKDLEVLMGYYKKKLDENNFN